MAMTVRPGGIGNNACGWIATTGRCLAFGLLWRPAGICLSTLAACLINFADPASAAQINKSPHETCGHILSGKIETGDPAAFRPMIENGELVHICLESPGGSYKAGYELAKLFSVYGVETRVRSGSTCQSACAIAFMGGSVWGDLRHPSRTLEVGGELGFHAPFVPPDDAAYSGAQVSRSFGLAIQIVSDLIRNKELLNIDDYFITEFLLFVGSDFREVRTIDTVSDAATANIGLVGYQRPVIDDGSRLHACATLYDVYRSKLRDNSTAWLPYFAREEDDLARHHVDPDFSLDGENRYLVATISDWDTYAPTASCAFLPSPSPDSGFADVIMWSNGPAEKPDIESAMQRWQSTFPDWYFYPASTRLENIAVK